MALEGTGGGELAQLVANHIFRHINGHMLAAVVHREGVTDEIREMVEDRLQVFRTRFSPAAFIS